MIDKSMMKCDFEENFVCEIDDLYCVDTEKISMNDFKKEIKNIISDLTDVGKYELYKCVDCESDYYYSNPDQSDYYMVDHDLAAFIDVLNDLPYDIYGKLLFNSTITENTFIFIDYYRQCIDTTDNIDDELINIVEKYIESCYDEEFSSDLYDLYGKCYELAY